MRSVTVGLKSCGSTKNRGLRALKGEMEFNSLVSRPRKNGRALNAEELAELLNVSWNLPALCRPKKGQSGINEIDIET